MPFPGPAFADAMSNDSIRCPTPFSTTVLNVLRKLLFMNGFWHTFLCCRLYSPCEPVTPRSLRTSLKMSGRSLSR